MARRKQIKVTYRIPEDLHDQIHRASELENLSANSWVNIALRKAVRKEEEQFLPVLSIKDPTHFNAPANGGVVIRKEGWTGNGS